MTSSVSIIITYVLNTEENITSMHHDKYKKEKKFFLEMKLFSSLA